MKPSSKSKAFAKCCKMPDLATPALDPKNDYKSSNNNNSMIIEMTPDLAEICGIHAGDGYMRKRGNNYELELSGGFDEKEYYDFHVVPLFERVFNIKIKAQYFRTKGTYGFRTSNKDVCKTLHNCGFPYGKKTFTVSVPEEILTSRNLDIIYSFVRGVFDTDGTLSFRCRNGSGYKELLVKRHTLPEISIKVCSKNLRDGVAKLLLKTGFHFSFSDLKREKPWADQFGLILKGDQDMLLWLVNISFKNITKLNRFLIWQKNGFCPKHLDLKSQKDILFKNLDPDTFYSNKIILPDQRISVLAQRQLKRINYLGVAIPKD